MTPEIIQKLLNATSPPFTFHVSDGRKVRVALRRAVIVSDTLVVIRTGLSRKTGVAKDIVLLDPEKIVDIEAGRRPAVRRAAPLRARRRQVRLRMKRVRPARLDRRRARPPLRSRSRKATTRKRVRRGARRG
jgi:hypothetical protein